MRLFFLTLSLFLISCSSKKPLVFEGWAMTMPYTVVIEDQLDFEQMQRVIEATNYSLKEVDLVYNNWNQTSEVSLFNQNKVISSIKVSKELLNLLNIVDYVHTLSEKRFDPTVAPLSMAFHKAFNEDSKFEFENNCPIGWSHINLTEDSLHKTEKDITLDLCGISKGYFLDLLIERLVDIGIANALVEWAGEIRTIGKKETGPWMVRIDDNLEPIALYSEAIATSGSRYQSITNLTHIIDPFQKKPLSTTSSIKKVSVKAPTCAIADALATSAMTFDTLSEAECWAQRITEQNHQISFWFF